MRGVAHALAILLLQVLDVCPNVCRVDRRVLIIGIELAAGANGKTDAPILVYIALHVITLLCAARLADGADVEIYFTALSVKENIVVFSRVIARAAPAGLIAPNDLVHEVAAAENLVQQQPEHSAHTVVDVQIQRARWRKHLVTAAQDYSHPIEVCFFRKRIRKRGERQRFLPRPSFRRKESPVPKGGSR